MEEKFCKRAKARAIAVADQILDEKGKLTHLPKVVKHLEKKGAFVDRFDPNDGAIAGHLLRTVRTLSKRRDLVQKVESFGLPLFDTSLEEMIALTLHLDRVLTQRDVIWGVLSALLTPLRQSVGSCFGTAPAILIHEEQPHLFLEDLQQLLTRGKLGRTFGGNEFVVPISPSPGLGGHKREFAELEQHLLKEHQLIPSDLLAPRTRSFQKLHQVEEMEREFKAAKWKIVAQSDHLLLKVWEYTIASFADVKTEFSRWNLYSSLGLHPDEKGGIGELIYQTLELKLEETNKKIEEHQAEYEIAFDQVRATEHLMRRASGESEVRRLKAEHQVRLYHMQACQDARDSAHKDAQATSEFFPFLIEQIVEKFQEHFQEIYDAEMQEVAATDYDDSPAGFRLLFKHGRTHVASWTFIHNKEEYIAALRAFFLAIEHPLIDACEWKGGKAQIPHLITAMIHHIESEGFLLSAFSRLAKAHRVPLKKLTIDDLETMEKKPWAYTSGGNIPTLLKTYFRRESSLSEEARPIEDAQDLAIFYLEMLKSLPPKVTEPFTKDPSKRMLATSPTHAFSLLPGQQPFCSAWEDPHFTYTYVRDRLLLPTRAFYEAILLTPDEQHYLAMRFASRLPLMEGHELQRSFTSSSSLPVDAFAKKLNHRAAASFLFEMLPLSPGPKGRRELFNEIASKIPPGQPRDIHAEITRDLIEKKLAPPPPWIFADTNWEKFYFAFVVSPATLELELWRTDRIGLTGAPMTEWAPYLTGEPSGRWSLYLRPHEYTT